MLRTVFPVSGDHVDDHLWLHRRFNGARSIADFGARAGQDATTAIQAAIDAAEAGEIDEVIVPQGTWYITQIVLGGSIRVRGMGPEASKLYCTADGHGILVEQSTHRDPIIEDVLIRDNIRATRTAGAGIYAYRTDGEQRNARLALRRVKVWGFLDGIVVRCPVMCSFYDCLAQSQLNDSYRFEQAPDEEGGTSVRLFACSSQGAGRDAFQFNRQDYSTLTGCTVDGAGRHGYHLEGTIDWAGGISLVSCGCERAGMNEAGDCIRLHRYTASEIRACNLSMATGNGITIDDCDGISIISNGSAANAGFGIYITDTQPPAAGHFVAVNALPSNGAGEYSDELGCAVRLHGRRFSGLAA